MIELASSSFFNYKESTFVESEVDSSSESWEPPPHEIKLKESDADKI